MKYKIVHGCIRVKNLEKSLDFYMNALSLREISRKDFPEHKFTLVYLSDEAGNFEIELTYNYDTEKPYDLGNGFSHFALTVDDLEGSHRRHGEMGAGFSNFVQCVHASCNCTEKNNLVLFFNHMIVLDGEVLLCK